MTTGRPHLRLVSDSSDAQIFAREVRARLAAMSEEEQAEVYAEYYRLVADLPPEMRRLWVLR